MLENRKGSVNKKTDWTRNPIFNGPISFFASVRLTVVLLSTLATTVLIGAWCPQESAVGQEKVIEQFGGEMAVNLHNWGITDIFHTPFFLLLIALISTNMVIGSMEKVFPKLRLLKLPLQFFNADQIAKMPFNTSFSVGGSTSAVMESLQIKLQRSGFKTLVRDNKLVAEYGKIGRLAPTITHIGLLTLLLGVTITSWTGFSGFKPVRLGDNLSFNDSEHSKQWLGKLPLWKVHVEATRREDYESGEAKQWYSDLSVVDPAGKVLEKQQISVNNPLSFEGVDVYQSSWGMDQIVLSFNGKQRVLDLRPMGKIYAAFLPLDKETILIFSIKNQSTPLRLFAKRPEWQGPKLLSEISAGKSIALGSVIVKYERAVPVTGLQYKCDPGLPFVFVAFGFIICGVFLAAIPFRHVWVSIAQDNCTSASVVVIGGRSKKSKVGFERLLTKIVDSIRSELPVETPALKHAFNDDRTSPERSVLLGSEHLDLVGAHGQNTSSRRDD